jgi:hypothetical protein
MNIKSLSRGKVGAYVCIAFLIATSGKAQDDMTPERFKALVAAPDDTNQLRAELASLPFWKTGKCSVAMKFQDGKTFTEDSVETAKTINGKYVIFSMNSKFYKQMIYSIAEYDEQASAIRIWGLYGDKLTHATVVLDPEKKISATSAIYGDFAEISVGSSSPDELSDHTLVYKNGILFMTRDIKIHPLAATNFDSH